MKKNTLKYILGVFGFSLFLFHEPSGFSAEKDKNIVAMMIGDIETIQSKNLTRISVTDPDVADISDAKNDSVSIVGKRPGQTVVFLWDDTGKRAVKIQVLSEALNSVKERIQKVLDKSGIVGVSVDENPLEGKVVVSGTISKEDSFRLEELLTPYGEKVLNLVKEEKSEELVQVDIQIIELNTSYEKNLGISWATSGNSGIQLKYPETLPGTNGKPEDYFKIGDFNRTSPLEVTVSALIKEGQARVLSKPRLVVMSGKEASFLVGGEIPISSTTVSASGGSTTENTTFKKYGVNLTVTPTIREGKIDAQLNIDISDIDGSKASGKDTAFITRTAQTSLFLDNGQTIVLAGLIKHSDGDTVSRVPLLSKIPVVGLLFRNRKTPVANADTEMVIIFTPTILRSKKFVETQTVMKTVGMNKLSDEIESKYEHEPSENMVGKEPKAVMENPSNMATMPVKEISSAPVVMTEEQVISNYAMSIQKKISQDISYPYEAQQNRWQGEVKLKLKVLKDGALSSAEVLQSSGHDVFDRDALNTAKIAAPYAAFGPEMKKDELTITVPIVYSQEDGNSKSSGK